jgi:hypothetical protein
MCGVPQIPLSSVSGGGGGSSRQRGSVTDWAAGRANDRQNEQAYNSVAPALRALIERQEAAGGNRLRGLALPNVTPTGPSDLKNLMSSLITPRGKP